MSDDIQLPEPAFVLEHVDGDEFTVYGATIPARDLDHLPSYTGDQLRAAVLADRERRSLAQQQEGQGDE